MTKYIIEAKSRSTGGWSQFTHTPFDTTEEAEEHRRVLVAKIETATPDDFRVVPYDPCKYTAGLIIGGTQGWHDRYAVAIETLVDALPSLAREEALARLAELWPWASYQLNKHIDELVTFVGERQPQPRPHIVVYNHRHGTDAWLADSEDEALRSAVTTAMEYADELDSGGDQQAFLSLVLQGELEEALQCYQERHGRAEGFDINEVNTQAHTETLEELQVRAAKLLCPDYADLSVLDADALNDVLTVFGTTWAEVVECDPEFTHPPTDAEIELVRDYIRGRCGGKEEATSG